MYLTTVCNLPCNYVAIIIRCLGSGYYAGTTTRVYVRLLAEPAELISTPNPAEPSQNPCRTPAGILQEVLQQFAEPAGGSHDPAAQVDPAKSWF